ncbi:MAG: PAS domain-containing sensor histidine kinase [Proteobacteria bacterium]|nr:PAS domain-containing sensor histidine kinase [Pseudomonadota bacterium]MDA0851380.1 PAS domain-containing sensor histidine kinase [Pseudomonadota bacterium]
MAVSRMNLSRLSRLRFQRRIATYVNIGLICLAPVLALVTYLILGPIDQGRESNLLRVILLCDLLYLLALTALVMQRVMQIVALRRQKSAGSQLHLRLTGVFSAMSLLPTATVAVFAVLSINMGFEAWFSDRVQGVIADSLEAAQAYEQEQVRGLKEDIAALASDLETYRRTAINDPQLLRQRLSDAQENVQRGLKEAFIIDDTGDLILRGNRSYLFDYEEPSSELIQTAIREIVIIPDIPNNELRALTYLNGFGTYFLLVSRVIDGNLFALLDETQAAGQFYQQLESQRGASLFRFGIIYLIFAVLLIAASVFAALFFAERLSRPIGRLTGAAQKVGEGALDTRVLEEEGNDEISQLSKYFNQMTQQLEKQRETLLENTEQIELRRRMFDSVLSSVTSGVLGLDAEGKVSFVNKSAERLLGGHEILENSHLSVAVPEFFPLFERLTQTKNESLQEELKTVQAGRLENLLVRVGRRRNEKGQLEGYVIAFDDVTDLVSAQRSAAWGDVARRIAHEIKNPLTPIQLSAERIRRKFAPKLSEESDDLERMTDVIVRQTNDLRHIIDEFSKFARLPQPKKSKEDLIPIVKAAVLLQENGQPNINFVSNIPQNSLVISIDATMISQALTNLLKNAGEAIDTRRYKLGGTIAGEIHVGVEQVGDIVQVIIDDNGIGLPQDRARLFEPYVTTRDKGTGLGLAIVKKIVEEHGGTLSLEDAPSFDAAPYFGARVVMSLPFLSEEQDENTKGKQTDG